MIEEIALCFPCGVDRLVGVLHRPVTPGTRAVVIIVGGPQYRVGSHRQFVLLARALADRGIAVLRFDYRGMGDSGGALRSFEDIDADIRAAIDVLLAHCPGTREVCLWGLCDAASAALMYAPADARVAGLVAANPWVRTEAGIARSYLRYYYWRRLFAGEFWRRLGRGEVAIGASIRSFVAMVTNSLRRVDRASADPVRDDQSATARAQPPFTERMRAGLKAFRGPVLLILSGDDLTAGEFKTLLASNRSWRRLIQAPRVTRRDLREANHTFSRRAWRDQVSDWTATWLQSW